MEYKVPKQRDFNCLRSKRGRNDMCKGQDSYQTTGTYKKHKKREYRMRSKNRFMSPTHQGNRSSNPSQRSSIPQEFQKGFENGGHQYNPVEDERTQYYNTANQKSSRGVNPDRSSLHRLWSNSSCRSQSEGRNTYKTTASINSRSKSYKSRKYFKFPCAPDHEQDFQSMKALGNQNPCARFGDKFNDYSYTKANMQGSNQEREFTIGDPDIRQLLSYKRHIEGEKMSCEVQNSAAIQRRASNCLESSVISPFTESNMSMFNQNKHENVGDSRDLQYQNISMGEYFTKNKAEFQRMPLRDINLSDKENRQFNKIVLEKTSKCKSKEKQKIKEAKRKSVNRQIGQLFQRCTELEMKLAEKENEIKNLKASFSTLNSRSENENEENMFRHENSRKNKSSMKTPKFKSSVQKKEKDPQKYYISSPNHQNSRAAQRDAQLTPLFSQICNEINLPQSTPPEKVLKCVLKYFQKYTKMHP
ncbi:unnamed protein product [Moneuplotes crassus]|uniref:Uncharacterized protein n=1 Tax=Euplotes crassus TaxID=5936 RepID=A0AAD1U941_EUPCR|nr:unnamed protein product [Moneuplotes crassus]